MDAWTKVVTDPLGLTAFALFLLFLIYANRSQKNKTLFNVAAVLALISGIAIAAYRVSFGNSSIAGDAQTSTSGDCSPIVDSKGKTTIRIECESGGRAAAPRTNESGASQASSSGTASPIVKSKNDTEIQIKSISK